MSNRGTHIYLDFSEFFSLNESVIILFSPLAGPGFFTAVLSIRCFAFKTGLFLFYQIVKI